MTLDRRQFSVLLAVAFALPAFAAEERGKPAEARALLARAVAHIKAVGREKALTDFMVKPGPWVDRDLYVTVLDMSGKMLSHSANPRMVGKENINLRDGNGTYHVKERLEIARAKGRGQQEFAFLNPMTKQIEPKLMFFERMDDIVVACGSDKPV